MIRANQYKRVLRYGAAFAAASLLGAPAYAGNLTVSTARTTPVVTSNADGAGPGDVTITAAGSVAVTSGATITVNSSNSVTNAGSIQNSGESNATGIAVSTAGGSITGTITNNGAISIPGPSLTSSLSATPVFNTGISVSGAGIFNGSLIQGTGATLTVGGNTSTAVAILSQMNGSFSNAGTITDTGDSSYGVKITGPLTGSFLNSGTITASGQSSDGVYLGANVAGSFTNLGNINSGAAASTNSLGNNVGARAGGPALWVAGNVNGILLEGNAITKANEAAGIPAGAATDSNLSGQGGSAALFISPGGPGTAQNVTIGALASDPSGASIISRGNILSTSGVSGATVAAMYITGATINGVDYHTTLTGAFQNLGGDISATSLNAVAGAISIGKFASLPSFINSGDILARVTDSTEVNGVPGGTGGGDTYGITIDAQASLPQLNNSGNITADAHGATASAYAIVDNSGTLTNVTNSGNITASLTGTGASIALDLSHGSANETVTNSGTINGDIKFGNGTNTLTSTGGSLNGNLTMGTGNDTVNISNTTLVGAIDLGTGVNSLSANSSTISGPVSLGGGNLALTSSILTIGPGSVVSAGNTQISGTSTLNFDVDGSGIFGQIKSTGTVVVGSGTKINVIITGAVANQLKVNLIEAGTLVMNADLTTLQPPSSIMYNDQLQVVTGNPNALQLSITRNTASQLGLSRNLGAVYEGVIPALSLDDGINTAMTGVTSRTNFLNDLSQLLPDASNATRFATLGAQDVAQGAIRRRLDGLLREVDEPLGRYRSSFWVQEITTYGSQGSSNDIPGYRVLAQSLAAGIDGEIYRNVQMGVSLSETLDFIQENAGSHRSINVSNTGLDFYTRYNTDIGFIQGIVGGAWSTFSSNRNLDIEDIIRSTGGSWEGNQYGGTVDVGTVFQNRSLRLTPYLRGSYTRSYQHGFHESGGGNAVDLAYHSTDNISERAGGGFVLDYLGSTRDYNGLDLSLRADYAHEFDNKATLTRAEFVSAGPVFTVQGLAPGASVLTGGIGAALTTRQHSMSLDYDAQYSGGYLAHKLTFTYRQRF